MVDNLSFDWFILLLRVLFVFLLYFFLYQVVRVTTRELTALAASAAPPAPVPSGHPSGRLVIVDGGESALGPGTTFLLRPISLVGRHRDCTVEIDEPFVSSEHAELAIENGRWWVRDLGSTNGTFVNGQDVRVPTGVKPGDIVQFGRVKLQFVP